MHVHVALLKGLARRKMDIASHLIKRQAIQCGHPTHRVVNFASGNARTMHATEASKPCSQCGRGWAEIACLDCLLDMGNRMAVGRRDTAGMPVNIGRMKREAYDLGATLLMEIAPHMWHPSPACSCRAFEKPS